jgi:hypothetical protein
MTMTGVMKKSNKSLLMGDDEAVLSKPVGNSSSGLQYLTQ